MSLETGGPSPDEIGIRRDATKLDIEASTTEINLAYTTPEGEVKEYPDPYSGFVKSLESVTPTEREMIRPEDSIVFNVDVLQGAFRDGGGLPLMLGDKTLGRIIRSDQEIEWGARIDSIDLHSRDNIGNAEAHGLPPFSNLELGQNGEVLVTFYDDKGQHTLDYESAKQYCKTNGLVKNDPEIYSLENVREYLSNQRDYRIFSAIMLGLEKPTNLGQTLWPLHGNEDDAEMGYLQKDKRVKPDLAIIKGGKVQGEKGKNTDSYGGIIASDGSVVKITEENGYSSKPTETSAGSALSRLIEERGIRNIVVRGLAFTHCNKFTAENLRLMQEISKLESAIQDGRFKNAQEFFQKRLEAMAESLKSLGLDAKNPDLIDKLTKIFEQYVSAGLKLDPSIRIVVHAGQSDPVRLPNVTPETQQGFLTASIKDYEDMGVDVITDTHIKKD